MLCIDENLGIYAILARGLKEKKRIDPKGNFYFAYTSHQL
jgi:hypothetical protein